jgi:BirA family biotin operon repressor/biotin-[acetyl-CoA-carboxylase] ligase|tara:strand:+ start:1187 stop:1702 length:516 start_codon:yes stop_codon:yes gene_type:complete
MKLKKYLYKSVTSTNDVAIKKIRQGFLSGIIISKKQTKGRGRYGNKWISIKNNLFMSVFFNLNKNKSLKNLTSSTCKIVQKSLLKLVKKKIKIKKPNDLLINEKKLCGILQETIFYKSKKFAIVGIGINVDRSPIIVNYPTTYVNLYTKKKLTSAKIYNEIKKNFEKYIKY